MVMRNLGVSREAILGFSLALLIAVPMVVLGGNKEIYVDKDASGSEDGTANHPYKSISKALKHAKEGTSVFVAKGTYKENVTVPKGVKLIGKKKDRGSVVIKADNEDKPTVTMKHHSELDHLTVKGGRHSIRVIEDARAMVYDVVVKDSDRDGIHIDAGPRDKKHLVSIIKTNVENSKRAGIFSEKRNITVTESNILSNGSDGIDLAAGTKAWIADNRINDNDGSGLKVILDDASIWTKSNSIRHNKREGVEVNAYGVAGTFGLKKAQLVDNGRYGIAKVARTERGLQSFGGIILGTDVNANRIDTNHIGNISPVLRGF